LAAVFGASGLAQPEFLLGGAGLLLLWGPANQCNAFDVDWVSMMVVDKDESRCLPHIWNTIRAHPDPPIYGRA
jgi:hypothetical protein